MLTLLLLNLLFAQDVVTPDETPTTTSPKVSRCLDLAPSPGHPVTSATVTGSDTEIAARLVYAETKAAGCPERQAQIIPAITSVILNRVRDFGDRPDAYRRVVFGRSQFASSLHVYKQSSWRDFACPKDDALFERVRQTIERMRNGELKSKSPTATHYYLHRHFGAYRAQPWGQKARLTETVGDCLSLFEVDRAFLKAPLN